MEGIFLFEVDGHCWWWRLESFFANRVNVCIPPRNFPTSSIVMKGDDVSLASGKPPSQAQNTIEKT